MTFTPKGLSRAMVPDCQVNGPTGFVYLYGGTPILEFAGATLYVPHYAYVMYLTGNGSFHWDATQQDTTNDKKRLRKVPVECYRVALLTDVLRATVVQRSRQLSRALGGRPM